MRRKRMNSTPLGSSTLFWSAAVAALSATLVVHGAPTVPDPCTLITVSELAQIVGPLKGTPKPGDIKAGDISCEYTLAKEPAWIALRLHDGELSYWKSRNGGKT